MQCRSSLLFDDQSAQRLVFLVQKCRSDDPPPLLLLLLLLLLDRRDGRELVYLGGIVRGGNGWVTTR
eukprot:COSAG02_NODE_40162_length_408_cov_1.161812_1_plen_67_part_00